MAERRKEVMDMVAQEVSWAKAGGTNRFVRLQYCTVYMKYRVYIQKTKRTQRKRGKPLSKRGRSLRITLIRLNRVSLDRSRRRREKVNWEMITDHGA